MIITRVKDIVCSDSIVCSENIVNDIEINTGLKLHAVSEIEVVEGYVTIKHIPHAHEIQVCSYDVIGKHEYLDSKTKQIKLINHSRASKGVRGIKGNDI